MTHPNQITFTRSVRGNGIDVKVGDKTRTELTWDEALGVMAAWVLSHPLPYVTAGRREGLCNKTVAMR
jgi:hypothetical protein